MAGGEACSVGCRDESSSWMLPGWGKEQGSHGQFAVLHLRLASQSPLHSLCFTTFRGREGPFTLLQCPLFSVSLMDTHGKYFVRKVRPALFYLNTF